MGTSSRHRVFDLENKSGLGSIDFVRASEHK